MDVDEVKINPYEEYNSPFNVSVEEEVLKKQEYIDEDKIEPLILEKNDNKTKEIVNSLLKYQLKALLQITQKQQRELNKKRKVNMVYYM